MVVTSKSENFVLFFVPVLRRRVGEVESQGYYNVDTEGLDISRNLQKGLDKSKT